MEPAPLAPKIADFYMTQSVFSEPNDLVGYYPDLPADPTALAGIVRNLLVHRLEGELFDYRIPPDRLRDDAETRYVDDILRLITGRDGAPLTSPRRLDDRFVGICRDFALLHCSFLRHAGVPARIRSGFADYFGDTGFHFDHVVCEYWDERHGWRLADPQLADPSAAGSLGVDFDHMDVPRDRFLVAGAAWRSIRAGEADPNTFGLPPEEGGLVGEWFVAGNVRLDLAMINKVEPLLWDIWGPEVTDGERLAAEDCELYDRAAALTVGDVPFEAASALFTGNDALRTPRTVLTRPVYGSPREVLLRG
ncbi:transglutaminase domain-containing protein [Pseudonocardia acaciae]|uniref:transglutaminase domain-containing protein n=1 Tax=Pseudonocardia acaciae TaxID=551276 RepID=UPI000A5A4EB6|nr:transglutaminase domain-containing protein [Pseudonocardia acaciae]